MPTEYQIILTTCPDQDMAEKLARQLVNDNLAACVNIVPALTSIYKWKNELITGSEVLLMIKTRTGCYSDVETLISGMHPYELPEIISVPINNGLPNYLQWIDSVTGKS